MKIEQKHVFIVIGVLILLYLLRLTVSAIRNKRAVQKALTPPPAPKKTTDQLEGEGLNDKWYYQADNFKN